MQLGIPSKLAPVLFAQALSRLLLVYSAYSVIFAEFLIILIAIDEGNWIFVWAGIAIGMPGFVLWRVMFTPMSAVQTLLYMGTLSVALGFATWAVLTKLFHVESSAFLPLTLVGFALITACGATSRTMQRWLWATIGYVMANLATFVGSYLAQTAFEFDLRLLIGYIGVSAAVLTTPRLLKSNTRLQVTLERSADDVATDSERSERARAVAAQLHDTVLANLAVISATKPGLLQDPLREALQAQLALLETQNSFEDKAVAELQSWEQLDSVMSVISQAEASGLSVNLSGDPSVVHLLSCDRVEALSGALAQCLTNVHRHSGQNAVEVVILAAGEQITVTVIDGGSGFDVDQVPEDRMGLKLSVRDRIERCGGTVRIWSNVGQGTAVMLQLPVKRGEENA